MQRISSFVLGSVLIFEIAAIGSLSQSASEVWNPAGVRQSEMFVRQGDSYRKVVCSVAEAVNLERIEALSAYGLASGLDRKIKKGRYKIQEGWSPAQAIEQTAIGPNDPLRVKILPGFTLKDCALALERSGWVKSASAWVVLASPELTAMTSGGRNLEGLLAAETYFFESEEPPGKVLERLQGHWVKFISRVAGTADLKARLRNGLTLHDTIVLASVVEREAANPLQMATAASVFHNRLRKNWPLGSAATLRYALGDWKGRDDQLPVSLKSPFNTSRRPGLPPRPICIPSEAALIAVIDPPRTSYLFFNGDGDGGLVFNKTHRGHKASVSEYRKKIESREKDQAIAGRVVEANTKEAALAGDGFSRVPAAETN